MLKTSISPFTYPLALVAFLAICLALPNAVFGADKVEKAAPAAVCVHAASHANSNRLNEILITSDPPDSAGVELPEEMKYAAPRFRKLLDINNDGILERVFVDNGGLFVYPARTDEPIVDWDERFEAREVGLIQFEKKIYVLGKTNLSLNYIAQISPKNDVSLVCSFDQRKKPVERLRLSRNDAVCRAASESRIDYVKFDKLHSASVGIVRTAGFDATSPGKKAALIDIDNDGTPEYVIQLSRSSAKGCEETFLAVLTPDRSGIDKQSTAKLPRGSCNDSHILPFHFNGKTYLDVKTDRPRLEAREILIMSGKEAETVCEFEYQPENIILTRSQAAARAEGSRNLWEYAFSQPGTEAVELLIVEGRNVNEDVRDADDQARYWDVEPSETGDKRKPINLALDGNRDDILEVLLKAGADPNVDGHQSSALADAVWRGTEKSVELLLAYGATDHIKGPLSAMWEAIYRGSVEKLRLLLDAGIPVGDDEAVQAVSGRGSEAPDKLRILLKHGLDVHRLYTVNVVAEGIRQESPGVTSVGPEIKFEEKSGTLLQWAKELGSPEIVRILLDAGAGASMNDRFEELRTADVNLNQTFRKWMDSLDEAGKSGARKEQLAWILERDRLCGISSSGLTRDDWLRHAAETESASACILKATNSQSIRLSLKLLPWLMSPDESVEDRTQAEWSKTYWTWSKSFPEGLEPFRDADGTRCAERQSGPVWFLTGGSSGTAVSRHCQIPADRHIFLPVLVSLTQSMDADGSTCEKMGVLLDRLTLGAEDLHIEIDGGMIPAVRLWRQITGCFKMLAANAGRSAASDGYWLMLKPLPPGEHLIRFRGRFTTDNFSQAVEYRITIQ